jgi:hypothetical protein
MLEEITMMILRLLWRFLFALVLLNGLLGCGLNLGSRHPVTAVMPTAPADPPGAHLSTVGIGIVGSAAEPEFETPPKGWSGGARRGAWLGASVPLKVGAVGAVVGVAVENGSGGGVFLAMASLGAGLALAPAGAVVGAMIGVAKAEPAERIERAERSLSNVMEGSRLSEIVRDYVIEFGREQTSAEFIPFVEGENMPAAEGLVELSVTRLGLSRLDTRPQGLFNLSEGWGADPPLRFELKIRARLRRQGVDGELAAREFGYWGGVLRFSEWTADEATALADEVERGARNIADDIVKAWFALPKAEAVTEVGSDERTEGDGP